MTGFNLMRDRYNKELAINTIREIDPQFSDQGFNVLAYSSPANKHLVEKVHFQTNLKIKESLDDGSLGTCVHITGRMNAINDAFHSDLCTNIFRKTENPFRFSYLDQDDPDKRPIDIIRQKQIMWPVVNWKRSMSALRKEALSQIESYSVGQSSILQFTIFGNRYVQLQSRHDDSGSEAVVKHVWLLESEKIHDILSENAEEVISSGTHVSPNLFREAYELISGYASATVLQLLSQTNNTVEIQNAIEVASDFHNDPTQVIEALQAFSFANNTNDEFLNITDTGRELLNSLSNNE